MNLDLGWYRIGNLYRYLAEFKGGIERKEFVDQSLEAYQVCGYFLACLKMKLIGILLLIGALCWPHRHSS